MEQIWKKIRDFVGTIRALVWIGSGIIFCAPFIVCFSFSDGASQWCSIVCSYFPIWISIWLAILFTFLVNRILHVRGGLAGPISLSTFMHRLNLCIYYQVLSRVHIFEHDFEKAVRCKQSDPARYKNIDEREVREFAITLLSTIKEVIRYITGADVAVHIKVFRNTGGRSGVIPIEKALLATYERVPSDTEAKRSSASGTRRRRNSEQFKILRGDSGRSEALSSHKKNTKTKFNSAYNYVFRDKLHFWIQNDLRNAEKRKIYASSSENWKGYYNSLCVFILSPRVLAGDAVQDDKVIGVLIVDSKKTGAFEYEMMKQVLGYFSHRMYAFLRIFGGTPNSV